MLNITFANRFETLQDALLDALDTLPASPFAAEQIIVPSAALRRRLTLAIADRRGICANVALPFLAQWLWQQIARVVPTVATDSPFAAPVLAWRIYRIFGDSEFLARHPRLDGYLAQADAVMRADLATRTAGLLEQYLTYRQDWLATWSDGRPSPGAGAPHADEAWQAALWQRIAQELGTGRQHPAATFLRTVEAQQGTPAAGLPAAAHIFCLPTMPPLYIDILRQLGRWMDLRLYVLNPCREYWFEVVDRRRLSYLAIADPAGYHEEGNRLLAAWGKQTQAQVDLLLEHAGEATVDDDRFAEADGGTLLARLQNAILDLQDLAPASVALADDDRSIEVHVCHSLTRQLEVLQDRLLGLFAGELDTPRHTAAQTAPPQPADILVVTPDLDAAAPLIDAVFGNAPRARFIPYAISGRGRSGINAAARALLALLELAGSRFTASSVFDLLQQPILGRRFGLGGEELATMRGWLEDSSIRWGIDGPHRAQFGLPEIARHSFDDGRHRLFLGYALPADSSAVVDQRLPAGNAEGSQAALLGVLDDVIARLAQAARELQRPQTPDQWATALTTLCETFLAPAGDELDDYREVRQTIHELHDNLRRGGIDTPVPREVIAHALEALLDDPAHGGVPTGMVTFSSMSSLRNLPFRYVCIIGLDDGAFPSTSRPVEFDLIAARPRRGDRQRRIDERNLFLDLLLAARDGLHLSYTGRSVRDNAPLPPSVLVAELLDYLVEATAEGGSAGAYAGIPSDPFANRAGNITTHHANGMTADLFSDLAADEDTGGAPTPTPAARAAARRRLVVDHPLQPFSLACFEAGADPRARSFNSEYCDALKAGLTVPAAAAASTSTTTDDTDEDAAGELQEAFFTMPLTAPGDEWREVSLDQLTEFFRNPCRYLLRRRLGLDLLRADEELQDDEPFTPDFAGRSALAARLLPALLAGESAGGSASGSASGSAGELAGESSGEPSGGSSGESADESTWGSSSMSADALRATGLAGNEYPAGRLGELLFERECKNLVAFADAVRADTAPPCLEPRHLSLDVDLDGERWRLGAAFADLRPAGLVRYRYDDTRPADYLAGWLAHLALCALAPPGVAPQTVWHSRDGCYRLTASDDARSQLAALLRLYRRGLMEPLRFFPKAAWKFAQSGNRYQALGVWKSTRQQPWGEENDAAYRLALRGCSDALDADFEACALTVFGPMKNCLRDERL